MKSSRSQRVPAARGTSSIRSSGSRDAMQSDAVNVSVTVPVDTRTAFRVFVDDLNTWWPRELTWSGAVLERITIDPRVDGLCTEIGPFGYRCDWGRVVEFEEGRSLTLLWQISPMRAPEPNPERASRVHVRFDPDGDATRVTLEHGEFERHGDNAEQYRAGMASEMGWPAILASYVRECEERSG